MSIIIAMNFYSLSSLFVCVTSLLSGLIIITKNSRAPKNIIFFALTMVLALWSGFYTAWQMATTYDQALLYIRISMGFGVVGPVLNLHAMMAILDTKTRGLIILRNVLYVIFITIALTSPTPYFIPSVSQKLNFPYWPNPGPVLHFHFINFFIPGIASLYLIWKKTLSASALMQNKLKWLFVAHVITYTGILTNNFLWYDIPIKPFLNFTASFGVIIFASTFFRLGVVDVGFFIRRALLGLGYLLGVSIGVMGAFFLFSRSPRDLVLGLAAALLALGLSPLMKVALKKFVLTYWKDMADTKEKVEKSGRAMKELTFTYDDLARNIISSALETFPIELAAVYFYDSSKREFTLRAQKGMKNPLTADLRYNRSQLAIPESNILIQTLEDKEDPVYAETFLDDIENEDSKVVADEMKRVEAEICAPFLFGGKTRGLLIFGKRKGNTLFNDDEMESIQAFARMGSEIMRYIMGMETELNHNALYSHDINHDIRSLSQTLNFLRSPMSQNQDPGRIQKLLGQAEEVASHLYESFQLNRDRSLLIMKTIRGEYEKKRVDLPDILKQSADKFHLQAEKNNIAYQAHIEAADINFHGNDMDLIRVFDNLIANAIRHLPETGGAIDIKGRLKENAYEIIIQDNGEGIDQENLENIFKMGWQAKDSKKGASGLGLAISKQIVQIHGGTITATSEGKAKGVTFIILFPY